MKTLILQVMSKVLLPLVLMFSVFVLLRGHNEPGGGFVGGLVAASVFILYAIVNGVPLTREALRVEPAVLFISGVSLALLSGLIGLFTGNAFLDGWWMNGEFSIIGHFGTPLVFDIGVYLTVIGAVLTIVFTLLEIE